MIPLSTVKLLRAWARWGEGQSIDYPSMSPMFGERALKTPLYGKTEMPADVGEMEHAVCMLSFDDRYLIVQWYCRRRDLTDLAKLIGVSRWRAMRLLKAAEAETHRQLEMVYELQSAVAYLK